MVIDDLDIFGTGFGPPEADPILVVDSDRVLPNSITLQLLEPQAWKREGLQRHGRIQAVQGLRTLLVKARWQGSACCLRVLAIEDVFRALVPEGDDQAYHLPWELLAFTLNVKYNAWVAS